MSKNTTQIRAAVVREKGGPFSIETLSLEGPRRDEVLVKVVATGLCHTDMVARDKGYPVPQPIVLGHEGSGIVESVGADVLKVAPGDSVVKFYSLDQINQAAQDSERGGTIKPVIRLSAA